MSVRQVWIQSLNHNVQLLRPDLPVEERLIFEIEFLAPSAEAYAVAFG